MADEAFTTDDLPTKAMLYETVDEWFHGAYPSAPERLHPTSAEHEEWRRAWLDYRDTALDTLVNQIYWEKFPGAPHQIDPANPAHDRYEQGWLAIRDHVMNAKPDLQVTVGDVILEDERDVQVTVGDVILEEERDVQVTVGDVILEEELWQEIDFTHLNAAFDDLRQAVDDIFTRDAVDSYQAQLVDQITGALLAGAVTAAGWTIEHTIDGADGSRIDTVATAWLGSATTKTWVDFTWTRRDATDSPF